MRRQEVSFDGTYCSPSLRLLLCPGQVLRKTPARNRLIVGLSISLSWTPVPTRLLSTFTHLSSKIKTKGKLALLMKRVRFHLYWKSKFPVEYLNLRLSRNWVRPHPTSNLTMSFYSFHWNQKRDTRSIDLFTSSKICKFRIHFLDIEITIVPISNIVWYIGKQITFIWGNGIVQHYDAN